jgi:hypothetical protein
LLEIALHIPPPLCFTGRRRRRAAAAGKA